MQRGKVCHRVIAKGKGGSRVNRLEVAEYPYRLILLLHDLPAEDEKVKRGY